MGNQYTYPLIFNKKRRQFIISVSLADWCISMQKMIPVISYSLPGLWREIWKQ